nr:zinc finger, CCHC-type [Tanacetum cinerariifolium]
MHPGKSQSEHIDELHKLVGDLAAIDTAILDEDQALLLLTSLPSSYDNFVETLLYGRDTLMLEDVVVTLNSRELQKMTKAKGGGGEGLYVKGDLSEENLKRDCPRYNHKKFQGGSYHITYMKDYLVDFEEYNGGDMLLGDGRECRVRGICKVQVHMRDGSNFVLDNVRVLVVLSGTRRANCVYTLDGQAVTRKTLKGRKQLGQYQTGWKIKTGDVLDSCNQRNMGFNESGVYKKTFIGSGVASDREQHSAHELFRYRKDSNEAAFADVATKKIYAHESLTFNDTVACEAISKWNARLNKDMDAYLDVYVLNNDSKKSSDDKNKYYWSMHQVTKGLLNEAKGNIIGIKIIRDLSGNTLRVSQSRFYNEKLVQTLLEGHSILSLEGSLSEDCDVEKKGKWSCIYAVKSLQVYHGVCMRPGIASVDLGSWKAYVQHAKALSTTEAAYVTLTEAAKEAIWLKGLAIESGFELKIVAGFAT